MPASMSYAGASLSRTGLARTGARLSMARMRPRRQPNVTTGTDLADTLIGWAGPDYIAGLAGNDYIAGGAGNDTIDAGAGNDTIDGGAGIDTLDYSAATDNIRYTMGIFTAQTLSAGQGVDVISGIENVIGGVGNDTLSADFGNNMLWGGDGNDLLSANIGNDTVYGGNGNDAIYGNGGDDLLIGGAGDDSIFGNGGFNTLEGGAGADLFYINTAILPTNTHLVTDFEPGVDKLLLPRTIFTVYTVGATVVLGTYLYYDQTTGVLSYSATNAGQASATPIAILGSSTHPVLLASDIVITA